MGLVFSISNFFINKISQGRYWFVKKKCTFLALFGFDKKSKHYSILYFNPEFLVQFRMQSIVAARR